MAEDADPIAAPVSTRDLLLASPVFRHLADDALAELEGQLEWFALPGGATLFEQGEPPDALYVLRNGSLGAFRRHRDGSVTRVGVVAAGETVGELGLIVDQPRTATIRALRDSELLRLSRAGFEALTRRHPESMLLAARIAFRRMQTRAVTGILSAPRTFAVLPHDGGVDAASFARALSDALGAIGDCTLVDAALGRGKTSEWFSALESRARYVVYLASADDAEWRSLCLRQADALLLAVDARATATAWADTVATDADEALHRPRHLVLLHPAALVMGAARGWLAFSPGAQHHHVRNAADIRRVARLLTGRSLGLVLSGGGARGFAQIGVLRALREAGLEIDTVGGTSIGAIIGAGVACDWSHEEMVDNYRRSFVTGRPLSDYTLPIVALTRGRRVARLLREEFGTRDIEDLVLPYFCCSSNLTIGRLAIHRQGPLWLWLRASCAIPGILPPVFHHGEVFVDGAVMNNLPTDIMHAYSPGSIAAVDIGADDVLRTTVEEFHLPGWWTLAIERRTQGHRRPGILDILLRSGMVNAEAASEQRRALASLLLQPPVHDVDLLDWYAYDRAIQAGYEYACGVIGSRNPGEFALLP